MLHEPSTLPPQLKLLISVNRTLHKFPNYEIFSIHMLLPLSSVLTFSTIPFSQTLSLCATFHVTHQDSHP
jgi:hypothetical protein